MARFLYSVSMYADSGVNLPIMCLKRNAANARFCVFTRPKTDDLDSEWITTQLSQMGFKVFIKNRHKVSTRRSGDMVVAVDRKLRIEHKKTDCEISQWIKLAKG